MIQKLYKDFHNKIVGINVHNLHSKLDYQKQIKIYLVNSDIVLLDALFSTFRKIFSKNIHYTVQEFHH